ncbi:MAG TPA: hypothetical protein VHT30_01345 [Acidimicrobiales bacterium]|nr:hypothetical protein [Acidimicrobiales bacterium]
MPSNYDPIRNLVAHVDSTGDTRDGRRRMARWIELEPALGAWTTAGQVAAACRAATGREQDRILLALISVAAGDDLAQLTAVAGLADRLLSILAGWERGGVARWELPGMATDLVSQCWAAVSRLADHPGEAPDRIAWRLVDEARERVRVPRRRDRRQSARRLSIHDLSLVDTTLPPVEDRLAVAIAAAVHAGHISRGAAAPVFLTRVAGFPVAEVATRLGYTPAVVRSIRSRAERRLVAA